ncbi:MAG: synthetase, partial [Rhodospirillales bacterium]|nr:synthetase [Rhodospirillales bacterium]
MSDAIVAMALDVPRGRAWRRFRRHPLALAGAAVLTILTLAAICAPLVEAALGVDANRVNLLLRFAPPSAEAWLGRDELGRDVLVRLLYGGQVSLLVGVVTALAAASIGTCIGLFAGFRGGIADAVLMRFTDSIIALPLLPLLIVLAALDLSKLGVPDAIAQSDQISLYRIVVIVALAGWTTSARLVRGAALTLRERDFIAAARSQGATSARIMFVHILP